MTTNLASFEYVLPLADPEAALDTVGGKGASLARLSNAGLPVQGGLLVTTLTGPVADQAALRGILCKLWDLNLTLISIVQSDKGKYNAREEQRGY